MVRTLFERSFILHSIRSYISNWYLSQILFSSIGTNHRTLNFFGGVLSLLQEPSGNPQQPQRTRNHHPESSFKGPNQSTNYPTSWVQL